MSLLATKTKQTRSEGGFVPRNGVLVDGDVAVLQDFLHFGAVESLVADVDDEQMVVSAPRHDVVAFLLEPYNSAVCLRCSLELRLQKAWELSSTACWYTLYSGD